MKDSKCIFCKIANGEIPSNTIYEDEDFRAILDLSPAAKGHALMLPKNHYKDLFEIPEEMSAKAFISAKKVAAQIESKLKCDGLNLVQNNGETAGQTVFHFHIHIIPRYKDDNQKIGWEIMEPTAEELEEIRKQIVE